MKLQIYDYSYVVGRYFIKMVIAAALLYEPANAQTNFIYKKNNKFFRENSEFYFLGFSAYYLQWMAADSTTRYIVDDVFKVAQQTGVEVIRIWGFNSSPDSTQHSIIRNKPYKLSENGLRALDYVIYKAKQYRVNLILALENNFNDFGGIQQYINWANQFLTPNSGKVYTHNDFFTNDSIKSWYKYYIDQILNRTNIYTLAKYKDESEILSYELINEASNEGYDPAVITQWYRETSDYFKSIDSNHLLTTGEIGYDNHREYYSDCNFFYNGSQFLLNGYKGTSFVENTALENIDYSSFHLYPDSWGLEPLAGNTWINDHISISNNFGKPALLGEFGVIAEKVKAYSVYLKTIRTTPSRSAIIWDYVHPDLMYLADSYAFNEFQNPELFNLFREHIQLLENDSLMTVDNNFKLFQNYPNPFNPATTIQYTLTNTEHIEISLYNCLGELIQIIESGVKDPGTYKLFLSFDDQLLPSGIYFYKLRAGDITETRKMILMK